jgi:hypothetical protein
MVVKGCTDGCGGYIRPGQPRIAIDVDRSRRSTIAGFRYHQGVTLGEGDTEPQVACGVASNVIGTSWQCAATWPSITTAWKLA